MASYKGGSFSSTCDIMPKRVKYVYGWGDEERDKKSMRKEIKLVGCYKGYRMKVNAMFANDAT